MLRISQVHVRLRDLVFGFPSRVLAFHPRIDVLLGPSRGSAFEPASPPLDVLVDRLAARRLATGVSGPGLADPEQPIQLSAEGDATVCFHGVAGGLPLAGLAWSIEGDHLTADDGCAFLDPYATTLTVSANGLSRTFDLEIAPP